jgi:hypothetical protein
MGRIMKIILCSAVVLLAGFLISCATPGNGIKTETRFRPDPKKDSKTAAVSLRTTGASDTPRREERAEMSSPLLPSFTVGGYLDGRDGPERRFIVTDIRVFDNWANGWTEGFFEASGILAFRREYLLWRCTQEDPLKFWGTQSGEIRYYDRFFRGGDGAAKVKARFDRISEAVDYMRRRPGALSFYGDFIKKTDYGKPLAPDIEEVFFFRTAASSLTDAPSPNLPENLRPVIANGTLFRDYEEAPGLWLSLYNLPYVAGRLIDGAFFQFEE